MKKFTAFAFTLFLLLIITGCGSSDAHTGDSDNAKTDSTEAKKEGEGDLAEKEEGPSAIPIETTAITSGSISNYLLYSSTLETEQLADVYPKIGGVVVKIFVDENTAVSKDQALLQIENAEYVLDEQKAKLEYDKQLINFKRFESLQAEELLSKDEFENARLSKEQARISWERAKLTRDYTTVRSPISGVVGERLANIGDRIQLSEKIFTIANFNEKIVLTYIPQKEFANTAKNQKAVITSDVFPGEKFSGYVKRKSPIIDPQSGTFRVTVAVNDPKNRLSPGMFINAQLIIDTHKNTPLIPKSALIYENERTYFYVIKADSAFKHVLKKGFEDSEKVEVLNEIDLGTQIVVLGQNGLKDGSKIKVIKEKDYDWQMATAKN